MNPLFEIDFYKVGHVSQYPSDTEFVWSNFTPRSTRVNGQNHVNWFGLQYFIKNRLIEGWNHCFFHRPWSLIEKEYVELIKSTLGVQNPKTDHLKALHHLGYLPIDIYSLPEGSHVNIGIPCMVITNTHKDFFWLPNYLETTLSNVLWKASTSATTAGIFRNIFTNYAIKSGEKDLSFIDWQGHDFSYRGMSGLEDAVLSGMGHLLSFSGTDTIPAILGLNKYYNAPLSCGGSVPATEHSVMCAGLKEDEFATFERLITKVYPEGIVSIVSDTWDLWKVLTDYIPRLKEVILNRNGKVVIRPDSGDPVKILTGDDSKPYNSPEGAGALELLARAVGVQSFEDKGELLNKMGLIYGDGISPERADQILSRAVKCGFSPYNIVFGIGSYTYEYCTRDTYGWAMKATAVQRNGKILPIFKNPVTDDGGKKSLCGIPVVFGVSGYYKVLETLLPSELDRCAFRKVFSNGSLLVEETAEEIRKRIRS